VDVTDAARVNDFVRRLNPWAVVNAAGYVRVDEAEGNREACWRTNVGGAVNLAAACRRGGIPLVTFSSDLVFDGTAGRPYTEDDSPNALNVYGASKAEADIRVREVLPSALIIRTSAFFGPWDRYNFLAAMFRDIDEGRTFAAPADTIVSPTYVPHLVHATLDLLLDGEQGVWHLANEGAVTWLEFARMAAAAAGRPGDLIEPIETARYWGPAARPAYSALASSRGRIMPPLGEGLTEFARAVHDTTGAAIAESCVSP
jgi:dTDP-4-dehydrorhamnose reductase